MSEIEVFEVNDPNIWNDTVEKCLHASVYHLWEWGEVLASTYGYERHYLVAKQEGGILGVFPLVYVKSLIFGNRLISLPFCEYGGPLVVDVKLKSRSLVQAIESLLNVAFELTEHLDADCLEVRSPAERGLDMFNSQGCVRLQRYVTFKVNLANTVGDLWRGLDKKTRNAVRKAMKNGVEVEEADIAGLKKYYKLYLETQKRHGSPPHTFSLFQKLYDVLCSQGKMKLLFAKYRGIPIAGVITFQHNHKVYWWSNVTDIRHRSLNPTNLLLWETIRNGAEKGFKTFDLGRTRTNTSIYHFKKGWGGTETRLVDYTYAIKGKDAITPDPSESKYQLLTTLWSYLPMCLSRLIGPKIVKQIGL